MPLLKEFRDFAMRGNVVDMAVGIVIGAAFGKIVSSLVNDIVMPPIGLLLSNIPLKDWAISLRDFKTVSLAHATAADPPIPTLNIGQFGNTVVDFLIVAFSIFMVIRTMNRVLPVPVTSTPPVTKKCPYCLSTIPAAATRCGQCTSELPTA